MDIRRKFKLSGRLYNKLLSTVAQNNGITVTDAKVYAKDIPYDVMLKIVDEIKATDGKHMSVYQIRCRLDDLRYEAAKRGLTLKQKRHNSKFMLELGGVADVQVWFYAKTEEFKVFEAGELRLASKSIIEVVADLESASW